jgi:hypothetical protein
MIPKQKGAEDSCPTCHQVLVCREKEYKGEISLQWQYKNKEEAHFDYDFKTKKTNCKESMPRASGSSTITTASTADKLKLDGLKIPGEQMKQIIEASSEMTERLLCVFSGVQKVCASAGITHPATVGMIYNQVCENRRNQV